MECWLNATGLKAVDKPLVTELWNGLSGAKSYASELVQSNKHFLHLVDEQDIAPQNSKAKGIRVRIPHERRMSESSR